MSELLQRLKTLYARYAYDLGRRLSANFFIYLAVVFTVLVLVDAATVNKIGGMRASAYDLTMRLRVNVPAPADDIVIIDIDEKTLAEMSKDYGRWPWPRQVLADLAEKISAQKPEAIVFDILFTDPDIQNPDSDAYFNDVLAKTPNAFLPMLRLDPSQDESSRLKYVDVPGAVRSDPALAKGSATVALVVPPFAGVQQPGRLGTNNIEPDSDGVARNYPVRLINEGWQIPSLPFAIAQANATSKKVSDAAPDNILLNWRGKPFTYHYVSFSDVYLDMQKEKPTRPTDEFTGKIVIIGATAAGLFDIKPTPLAKQFPGVEILATAIDNLRRGDWIRAPDARWFYLLMTLAVLWGTAFAYYRSGAGAKVDRLYGFSAIALLGFSYATVNLGNLYINLAGPVFLGALYFSIARFYAFATARALDTSLVARMESHGGALRGLLVTLTFPVETREENALQKLALRLQADNGKYAMSTELISGRQSGLWRLFENTLVLCWAHDANDDAGWIAIRTEVDMLLKKLPESIRDAGVAAALPANRVVVRRGEGRIRGQEPGDWQLLLGAALLEEGKSA